MISEAALAKGTRTLHYHSFASTLLRVRVDQHHLQPSGGASSCRLNKFGHVVLGPPVEFENIISKKSVRSLGGSPTDKSAIHSPVQGLGSQTIEQLSASQEEEKLCKPPECQTCSFLATSTGSCRCADECSLARQRNVISCDDSSLALQLFPMLVSQGQRMRRAGPRKAAEQESTG